MSTSSPEGAVRVSLVMTVLNEGQSIERLLRSLLRQTRRPDEVVIVDGGSTDDTLTRLELFAQSGQLDVVVLSAPASNISQGRNIAIQAARNEIIAVTDAGVQLEEDWLEQLMRPFESQGAPDVVSGFFVSAPRTLFERVLGAITLPRQEEIDPQTFHPSSRSVAFRKKDWEAVGGYPEWLDYCEDLLFDFWLRDAGFAFAFAPRALVHFRPRTTLRAFFKQYYRYARGDGKADFWRYRHLIRYGTYGALLLPLLLVVLHHPIWGVAWLAGLAATLLRPLRRLWPHLAPLPTKERLQALLWMPLIYWTGDVAKMLGYPVGLVWRWRQAPKTPWPKRQF